MWCVCKRSALWPPPLPPKGALGFGKNASFGFGHFFTKFPLVTFIIIIIILSLVLYRAVRGGVDNGTPIASVSLYTREGRRRKSNFSLSIMEMALGLNRVADGSRHLRRSYESLSKNGNQIPSASPRTTLHRLADTISRLLAHQFVLDLS